MKISFKADGEKHTLEVQSFLGDEVRLSDKVSLQEGNHWLASHNGETIAWARSRQGVILLALERINKKMQSRPCN